MKGGNKKNVLDTGASQIEWDPNTKESWFFEFEKEPINDEKWSCIVTAAVQNETQDEECIQTYVDCVNTGLRKNVKIISMADVITLLKNNNTVTTSKREEKPFKSDILTKRTPQKGCHGRRFPQIIELAAKYATYTATECKLAPELMAAVLKYIICNLKEENCLRKRTDAVKERKIREQNIKRKFIRGLKPFEPVNEDVKSDRKVSLNTLDIEEPINDEPIAGPDLYILLTDFYNPLYFTELQRINVPFVAILKISSRPEQSEGVLERRSRRVSAVAAFWDRLNQDDLLLQKISNVAMVQYQIPKKTDDLKQYRRCVFDELTWTQYSVYCIWRQHQKYLNELHVQKMIMSLEALDLSKCEVYNKLCDALVTGEPLTPMLVLYAMVEQVVSGVPQTDSVVLDYQITASDIFMPSNTSTLSEQEIIVTPCKQCRGKKYETSCERLKRMTEEQLETVQGEDWIETSEENSTYAQSDLLPSKLTADISEVSSTSKPLESLINKVLTERKTEKEIREDKRWKTPSICFYGDFIYLQTYFCDPRLFDCESIIERFFKNSTFPHIWKNYPEPSLQERAFYNFHLNTLLKISKLNEDQLKTLIFFTLSMQIIGRAEQGATEHCHDEKREIKLHKSLLTLVKGDEKNFRNYFLKTFIAGLYFRKIGVKQEDVDLEIEKNTDSQFQINSTSSIFTTSDSRRSCFEIPNTNINTNEKILTNFHSVLNCDYISNLTESGALNGGDFQDFIQNFKFYEQLEPNLMLQRLVEAKDNFKTTESSYFAPTDTLILVLKNDCDERGISCSFRKGAIHTPVCLRDFYRHVYPEITNWLIIEEEEDAKFNSKVAEKARMKEEKKDAEFLHNLKQKYCEMSNEKRKQFLETDMNRSITEVKEHELGELPLKPKPKNSNRTSFVVTNYMDIRVENRGNIREFFSKDGTQVRVTIDNWLYDPSQLIRLRIKRSNFSLYYNQWLGHYPTTDFTLRTNSDIIFSFRRDDDYNKTVTISWPTGLIIKPVPMGNIFYIKQTYLKPYRRGWDIEDEKSRCFLKDGKVIIFKKNGDYDILLGSGTKYNFYDSNVPRYDIISTTGEVWQVRTKGPCKNRKTFMSINKIFMGVDPNTKETFYKREDGTCCMLWLTGKLVTNYPDGTKITTTPYFEEVEVTTEWTDEEKLFYGRLDSKLESRSRSKTILRNSSTPRLTEGRQFVVTGFTLISCVYLMEHPKYSSVYFNPNESYVKLTMPEELTVTIYPEGNYEIQQDRNFLNVADSIVEFYKNCPDCSEKSSVKLYLESSGVLCECVDFFQEMFSVYRNGETKFQDFQENLNREKWSEITVECEQHPENSNRVSEKCANGHVKNEALMQRIFAFQRDLSGIEFLHTDYLSFHFYTLPDETYFELNTDDPNNISHTSNSPHYKIGYEKWVMEYEENNNSLPTNLKKKDMKEVGVKQITRNTFKFPFPKHHNYGNQQENEKTKRNVSEPKVIISRTVRCLSPNPISMMEELRNWVAEYQEKAVGIFNEYRKHKVIDERTCDSRYVEMRLRKIALTLSQSLQMYPHLCTNLPSTEKDIHYFGHFINSMQGMQLHFRDESGISSNCKQICNRLPRSSEFSSLYEENESPRHT